MKPLLFLAFVLRPPLGLDLYMPVPESNPLTPAKVALGRSCSSTNRSHATIPLRARRAMIRSEPSPTGFRWQWASKAAWARATSRRW